MERLRTNVRAENVYGWLGQFLRACGFALRPDLTIVPAGG